MNPPKPYVSIKTTYHDQGVLASVLLDLDGSAKVRKGADKRHDVIGLSLRNTGFGAINPPKRSQRTQSASDANTYELRHCIACGANNAEHSIAYLMVGFASPHRVNRKFADRSL